MFKKTKRTGLEKQNSRDNFILSYHIIISNYHINIMKRIIVFVLACLIAVPCMSQTVDEVSLLVTGSGSSKDIAVQSALRSAVEQAYGVFVSANTQILNDELMKDEIATVSSGNIKSYKEIDSQELEDHNWIVSLRAVVSTSSLASYAKSKGASCEFAGAIFGANLKLLRLNQQNTKIAFEHMVAVFKEMEYNLFDFSLNIGDPKTNGSLDIFVNVNPNKTTVSAINFLYKTLKELSLSESVCQQIKDSGEKVYSTKLFLVKAEHTSPQDDGRYYLKRYYLEKGNTIEKFSFYSPLPINELKEILSTAIWNFSIQDNLGNKYRMNHQGKSLDFFVGDKYADYFSFGFLGFHRRVAAYQMQDHLSTLKITEGKDIVDRYGRIFANSLGFCSSGEVVLPVSFILPDINASTNENPKAKKRSKQKQQEVPKDVNARVDELLSWYNAPLYQIGSSFVIPVNTLSSITGFEIISGAQ